MEDRTTITEVVLAGAELPEVPGSAGNSVIEQVENDLSGGSYIALQVRMFLFLRINLDRYGVDLPDPMLMSKKTRDISAVFSDGRGACSR